MPAMSKRARRANLIKTLIFSSLYFQLHRPGLQLKGRRSDQLGSVRTDANERFVAVFWFFGVKERTKASSSKSKSLYAAASALAAGR